jgi:hypothetical protein
MQEIVRAGPIVIESHLAAELRCWTDLTLARRTRGPTRTVPNLSGRLIRARSSSSHFRRNDRSGGSTS